MFFIGIGFTKPMPLQQIRESLTVNTRKRMPNPTGIRKLKYTLCSQIRKTKMMFRTLMLSVGMVLFTLVANSQVVTPADAAKLVGKKVTVCGEIFNGKYLEDAKNAPTLLNMGANFPKQPITIVIWPDVRRTMGFKPEEALKHKHICVTGTVERFKGSAQIVIQNRDQLRILQ
jgi:hypothetical protein